MPNIPIDDAELVAVLTQLSPDRAALVRGFVLSGLKAAQDNEAT